MVDSEARINQTNAAETAGIPDLSTQNGLWISGLVDLNFESMHFRDSNAVPTHCESGDPTMRPLSPDRPIPACIVYKMFSSEARHLSIVMQISSVSGQIKGTLS